MTTTELIERLEGVKRQSNGWTAKCPAHNDRRASLSIADAGDDLLLTCHAGCSFDAILAAVPAPPRAERVIDTVYPYRAADGTHLYDVVRFRPKDFRQRRADGTWSLNGVERVPYRLPELLASTKGVVIVEGERDVDRLAALGIVATCNPGGAGKWRPEYAEHLRGRTIVVIPDNDDPGRVHADDVARSLAGEDVRLLELSGLPPKGDVSDWLDAGHTADELRVLLRTAPVHVSPPVPTIAVSLAAVEAFLRRFVVFGRPEALVAVVLWIAHTFALDHADATPYLGITSPEKGSGKTRLLECLRLLARGRPGVFIIPTASTIYRMLQADPDAPLLLDELDAVFRDRTDKYEEVRAIINAGHRRGATVPRTVSTGNRHEVQMFPVFGPRALAGIGKLPDTVADRSIPVLMLKKKRSETVDKFRDAAARREAEPIATALEVALRASPPARVADVPDELPDRAADAWEPLLAIADAAGGSWPARARAAAIILHADRADDDSLGLRMLADTRLVFERSDVDRLATAALIEALRADEESPWVDEHKPLTPERLAKHLRPFGIRSTQMKVGGVKVRGFLRESFVDSWDRYLPPGTPLLDTVPRYPERAQGTEVPGWSRGTGSDDGVRDMAGVSVSEEMAVIFGHDLDGVA